MGIRARRNMAIFCLVMNSVLIIKGKELGLGWKMGR
jgi:hypothetical protein